MLRRWIRALPLALALAACAAADATRPPSSPRASTCRAPERELATVWDEGRRAAIERGLAGLRVAHLERLTAHAVADVDAVASAWTRSRAATCDLTPRHVDRARFAVRAACESAALAGLSVVAERLEVPDAAALEGLEAALVRLEATIDGCRERARDLTALPAWIAVEVAALDGLLAADADALSTVERRLAGAPAEAAPGDRHRHLVIADAALRSGDHERAALELADAAWTGADVDAVRIRLHLARGDHERAAALARGIVVASANQGWPLPRSVAAIVGELESAAAALRRVGDFAAASAALDDAASLEITHSVGVSRREAAVEEARGVVRGSLGDFTGAIERHSRALELRRSLVGDRHPDVARSHHHLGAAYEALARPDRARAHYGLALDIRLRALGEHPDTARTYNSLGNLAFRAGDHEEALQRHAAARAIRVRVFGEDHPETATSDTNIGMVELAQGDAQAALARFQRALEIRLRALGEDHPNTAITHNNLGLALAALGEVEAALEHHRRALAIRRAYFGDAHLEVARSHHNLGALLLERGDLEAAREHLAAALAIRQASWPPGHPERVSTEAVMARLEQQGRPLAGATPPP